MAEYASHIFGDDPLSPQNVHGLRRTGTQARALTRVQAGALAILDTSWQGSPAQHTDRMPADRDGVAEVRQVRPGRQTHALAPG